MYLNSCPRPARTCRRRLRKSRSEHRQEWCGASYAGPVTLQPASASHRTGLHKKVLVEFTFVVRNPGPAGARLLQCAIGSRLASASFFFPFAPPVTLIYLCIGSEMMKLVRCMAEDA
ncbi:hypothetical protein EVAR_32238_1 [Eumeta japonica]|uniref:Uncharacterized protein n=1 Tax=Eumeta variegata TaxID=151549 RepID=A0A4C1YNL9_EUMVA|nr:hypothetical protein EVAR_32238_1 [Eumeta japonica]